MPPFTSHRKSGFWTWFKLCLALSALLASASLLTPYPAQLVKAFRPPAPIINKPSPPAPAAPSEPSKPKPAIELLVAPSPKVLESEAWRPDTALKALEITLPPYPPALPTRVEPGNYKNFSAILKGLNLSSQVNFTRGTTASQDRKKRDSYVCSIALDLRQPQAAEGDDLLYANRHLREVLRDFDALMASAKVSSWYSNMYKLKQNRIRKNAANLERILDRHNFYDTDTILEITAPQNGRKLLWIQADMDVVSDGSDGDRLPKMPERILKSDFYQPSTSYRWEKLGKTPNPLLPYWQERYAKWSKKDKNSSQADHAKRRIYELKRYSFLLADYDPFVVLSLSLREGGQRPFRAQAGDYVVVIVGKKAYPAIVGDYGPRYKNGEASLRLCKEINPRAGIYSRPVSDLGVSYLVFPGTKEPKNGPLDYDLLYERCSELLQEIGGLGEGVELIKLKDLLPKPNYER